MKWTILWTLIFFGLMATTSPSLSINGRGVPDPHRLHTYAMLTTLAGALAIWVGRKVHPLVGLAFGYFVWTGLHIFAQPISPWHYLGEIPELAADATAAHALACLLLVSLPVVLTRNHLNRVLDFFAFLCGADAALMLIHFATSGDAWGILRRDSVDSTFIACLFPILAFRPKQVLNRWEWLGVVCACLAILVSGTSAGFLTLALSVAVYTAVKQKRVSIGKSALLLAVITLPLGWILMGKKLLDPHGRTWAWGHALDWFIDRVDPVVGAGLGMWGYLGPLWQRDLDQSRTGDFFIWLHNDWFQVLWETGVIGFLLSAAVYGLALKKSIDRPWLFSALAAYGFAALTQMPLRIELWALLGAVLVVEAYREQGRC